MSLTDAAYGFALVLQLRDTELTDSSRLSTDL